MKHNTPFTGLKSSLLHSGVHFGILQSAIYFIILCNVTATFIGYFAMVLAWVGGVVLSLQERVRLSYRTSLFVSCGAYYFLLGLTGFLPPYHGLIPIIALLIGLIAFPAGTFFKYFAGQTTPYRIFFHENNGFIIGNLLGLLFFLIFGIRLMYWAPLISLALVWLSLGERKTILTILPVSGIIMAVLLGNHIITLLLVLLSVYALCLDRVVMKTAVVRKDNKTETYFKPEFASVVLFLAGINLVLLQYMITREFSTVLAASELTILIVGTAYFVGYSIGYGLAPRLSYWFLILLAVASFFLHLVIIFSINMISGYLIRAGMGMTVLIMLILLTSLVTSSFYSILLPRVIAQQGSQSLARYYRIDLLGAATGVFLVIMGLEYFPALLPLAYFTILLVLIYILMSVTPAGRWIVVGGAVIIGLLVTHQDRLHQLALEDYYTSRGYDFPRMLFAANSFYHSVDVIDTFHDREQSQPKSRVSFINGVRYFDYKYNARGTFSRETGLSEFTWFLAELPARYLHEEVNRPLDILILGGGSLYSLRRVEPYARQATLVEIDRTVVESALLWWADLNRFDQLEKVRIVVDDAKHFLQTRDDQYDLIIMDISAPYYLGTMLLHNRDFFRLVKKHLKPGGIFSESTQGRPYADRPGSQGMKILKGVADVFPHYRVIDGHSKPRGRHGFVMASDAFPFSTHEIVDIMKDEEYYAGTSTYSEGSQHFDFSQTEAFSLLNMETLLSGNQWRMQKRLRLRDRDKRSVEQYPFLNYRLPMAVRETLCRPGSMVLLFIILTSFIIPLIAVWRWAADQKGNHHAGE
ncbi:MAG: spermidine synthase [Fidelibacterota bacterium]